jgi:hypothetical protein
MLKRPKRSGRIVVAVGLPVILAACTPAASQGNSAAGVPAASQGNSAAGVPAASQGNSAEGVPVASGWTAVTPVPGLAGLGTAGMNQVTTVSCTAPGDCTVGGYYLPLQNAAGGIYRPFVVTESGGRWGRAAEVPGVGAQPAADPAILTQVSCSSPGNCAAVGNYFGVPGNDMGMGGVAAVGFTVTQANGRWGDIHLVPSPVGETLHSVSCARVPAQVPRPRGLDCVAVGNVMYGNNDDNAVTVDDVNGTWRRPREVQGLPRISGQPTDEDLLSVSCSSPGNCAATGYYTGSASTPEAFIVTEEHGRWGTAWPVAGPGPLGRPYAGWGLSVSCPADGRCTATGYIDPSDVSGVQQAYVASQRAGTWQAAPLSGSTGPVMVVGVNFSLAAVACSSPGNCAVDGSIATAVNEDETATDLESYVATESGGTWGPAQLVAGGAFVTLTSLSCPADGECTAGGSQAPASGGPVPILIGEHNGHWGTLFPLAGGPFTGTISARDPSIVDAISCPTPTTCVVAGFAISAHVPGQGFTAAMTRIKPAGRTSH